MAIDKSIVNVNNDNSIVIIAYTVMPDRSENDAYQTIWLIRRLFRAFAQKSGEGLEGLGISVADRAVMEFLYPQHSLSVPEIAEKYQVSRQHIQVTVNALLEKGLVATRDNPRHKRSPLIALNARGRKLFTRVIQSEEAVVEALFSAIPKGDLKITRHTLQTLFDRLS